MATVLFLHGPSSSGKSTIAAAIRDASDRPWLHLSIDHLRDSGAWTPSAYANWPAARSGFFEGFHRAIAGFADTGNDLILEHILDTPGWHARLQRLLATHTLLFVGVHAPLETLTLREHRRGDRPAGSAARDHAHIHSGLNYDLELDGTASPQDNAGKVLSALASPPNPSRFFLVENTPG
ncbi:chloramphenicol phosphotransferase CPT family protein [Ruegeria sp. WL0004]|uniref:Chloramphenicol phosphotransferase CPT family protein n=1 Tax=Ruegeria marisflavi TaxID=2984152 RepID=A0ABT2WVB1_9RHOB|nr:chloramphenicol phosphotransferase CPT family protein [Ruegeria sp. WL0004]MCU9839588.1 chloramphenicol phosphotransferase CPT family protein [Ruegeria sp. WL0004]